MKEVQVVMTLRSGNEIDKPSHPLHSLDKEGDTPSSEESSYEFSNNNKRKPKELIIRGGVTPRLGGPLTTRQPVEYMWSLSVSMPQNECLFTRDSHMSKNGHVGLYIQTHQNITNYITIVSRLITLLIQNIY